jgi:hypothetical protein
MSFLLNRFPSSLIFYDDKDADYISREEKDLIYHLKHPKARWFPNKFLTKKEKLLKPAMSGLEISKYIEQELVECGRSVYVDRMEKITSYATYLKSHYPLIDFYTGRKTIFGNFVFLWFDCFSSSRVPNGFKRFVEMGMYQKLSEFSGMKQLRMNKNGTTEIGMRNRERFEAMGYDRVTPLNLKGSLQTLFIIFGICIGISVFVGGIENREKLAYIALCSYLWLKVNVTRNLFKIKIWVRFVRLCCKNVLGRKL